MEYSERMQRYNHNCQSVLKDCTYFPRLCISQLLSQNVSEIFLFVVTGVNATLFLIYYQSTQDCQKQAIFWLLQHLQGRLKDYHTRGTPLRGRESENKKMQPPLQI
jgi:hypothetical protein